MKGVKEMLVWCGAVIVAASTAISFLFLTFQTSADAAKDHTYFDGRLDRLDSKLDQVLEQTKK